MIEKSESIVNLAKALVEFHKEVPAIKKSSENPFFKSKYADLAALITDTELVLVKNGLTVAQLPNEVNRLWTILMHTSGEFIAGDYTMNPAKVDPQGVGSAITYQRRYAYSAILGLKVEDEDDDANEASGNGGKTGAAPRSETFRGKAPNKPVARRGNSAADEAKEQAAKFEKAKKMVNESSNVDGLMEYAEKLKKSTSYTDEQKAELGALLKERIDELTNGA